MKFAWLIVWLALMSACSSHKARCDKHLHPINVPNETAVAPGTPASRP